MSSVIGTTTDEIAALKGYIKKFLKEKGNI